MAVINNKTTATFIALLMIFTMAASPITTIQKLVRQL